MRKIDCDKYHFRLERNKTDFVEVYHYFSCYSDDFGTHSVESIRPTYVKVLKETGKNFRVGVCQCQVKGNRKLYSKVEVLVDKDEFFELKKSSLSESPYTFLSQYKVKHPHSSVVKTGCLEIDTTYSDLQYREKPGWVEEVDLIGYLETDGEIRNSGK